MTKTIKVSGILSHGCKWCYFVAVLMGKIYQYINNLRLKLLFYTHRRGDITSLSKIWTLDTFTSQSGRLAFLFLFPRLAFHSHPLGRISIYCLVALDHEPGNLSAVQAEWKNIHFFYSSKPPSPSGSALLKPVPRVYPLHYYIRTNGLPKSQRP